MRPRDAQPQFAVMVVKRREIDRSGHRNHADQVMHLAISRGSAALRVYSESNFRSCGPSAPVADNFAEDIARIFCAASARQPTAVRTIATPAGGTDSHPARPVNAAGEARGCARARLRE